jgi:hypothetical protein
VSKDQPQVVVIAPEGVPIHIRKSDVPILRFASSAEFEKWRKGAIERVETAVRTALDDLRIDITACSPRTQEVMARLQERESVPSVKELLSTCSSRRSFYRSWTDDIGEAPAAFLDRVRLAHLRVAQHGTPYNSDAVR